MSVKDPADAEMAALEELADLDGARVLEVGCGDGRLTFRYAPRVRSVLGVDSDAASIGEARAATPSDLADRLRFEVMDAAALDVPQHEFDLVFFSWSL